MPEGENLENLSDLPAKYHPYRVTLADMCPVEKGTGQGKIIKETVRAYIG